MIRLDKLLLFAFASFSTAVTAQEVSVEAAKSRALEFISSSTVGTRHAKGTNSPADLSLAYTSQNEQTTSYYVFNNDSEGGFVIVSGNDVAVPILGYSEHGSFDYGHLPSNLQAWLDVYDHEIAWASQHPAQAAHRAPAAPTDTKTSIGSLVKSSWDQGDPYNKQCVFNNTTCLTGCVATAMAQIMYYWGTKGIDGQTFPCGSKGLPSYTCDDYYIGPLAQLESFDWENMTNSLLVSTNVTAANVDAVAQLMRYCGQAINSHYGTYETTASPENVVTAFKKYFGYNPEISEVYSASMTDLEWIDLIYAQLADRKPVMMHAASDDFGGHEFICDGYYADAELFNFNWGWGGSCDGLYAMSALNPGFYDFSGNKGAIIDIMPLGQSLGFKDYAHLSSDGTTLTFYSDDQFGQREGISYNIDNFIQSVPDAHQPWYNRASGVTEVVFDASFANASPISTSHWFEGMSSLTKFTNLQNLNTISVANMSYMFAGCESLTFLNLSNLMTNNVTDMSYMFSNCSNLREIFIYGNSMTNNDYVEVMPEGQWMTENLTTTRGMYSNCVVLEYAPVSHLLTYSVIDMSHMFEKCQVFDFDMCDIAYLYTSKVTDMSYMFSGCFPNSNSDNTNRASTLELTHFDTFKVIDMSYMFDDCPGLTTIYCNDDWGQNRGSDFNSNGMFSGCLSLEGAIPYNGNCLDAAYANPSTGYFQHKDFVILSDTESNTGSIPNWGYKWWVMIEGRTLYKDGHWNTLCLPFDMLGNQVTEQLAPSSLMTLSTEGTGFSDGVLTLNFKKATRIKAGEPYIIRWERPTDYEGNESKYDIVNPQFSNVEFYTVRKTKVETPDVDFVGIFSPVTFATADYTTLYLGSDDQLYYPNGPMTINSFRGYFQLKGDLHVGTSGANAIRAFNLNSDDETSGITTIHTDASQDRWHTLDGYRLDAAPTTRGIYILNGKKVMIK